MRSGQCRDSLGILLSDLFRNEIRRNHGLLVWRGKNLVQFEDRLILLVTLKRCETFGHESPTRSRAGTQHRHTQRPDREGTWYDKGIDFLRNRQDASVCKRVEVWMRGKARERSRSKPTAIEQQRRPAPKSQPFRDASCRRPPPTGQTARESGAPRQPPLPSVRFSPCGLSWQSGPPCRNRCGDSAR